MIRTSCIRRPCITERRMQCCQILNTSVVIYVYKLYNPTVAVFMDHSHLSNNCIDRLSISWRKTIRKALNIPVRTHSVYLPLICECLPLNVQLELRVMKFFYERFK